MWPLLRCASRQHARWPAALCGEALIAPFFRAAALGELGQPAAAAGPLRVGTGAQSSAVVLMRSGRRSGASGRVSTVAARPPRRDARERAGVLERRDRPIPGEHARAAGGESAAVEQTAVTSVWEMRTATCRPASRGSSEYSLVSNSDRAAAGTRSTERWSGSGSAVAGHHLVLVGEPVDGRSRSVCGCAR